MTNIQKQDAQLLWNAAGNNFVAEQPDRFEAKSDDDPLDKKYSEGTISWCDTAANASRLQLIERQEGFSAMILRDLASDYSYVSAHVVLSSRTWIPFSPVAQTND